MISKDGYVEEFEENIDQKKSIVDLLKRVFNLKMLLFIFVAFMISRLEFMNSVNPFSYAIVGALCLFNVPLFVVILSSILGILTAGFDTSVVIKFAISMSLFLALSTFINIEGVSKKIVIAIKLIVSILVVDIAYMFFTNTLMYDMIITAYEVVAVAIFYTVFASGIYVVKNYNKTIIFSKEELIAVSILLAVAVSGFGNVNLFGLSLKNILGITIVLILGYKNGLTVGACAGTVIGLILGIVGESTPIIISAYAFSGLMAGLLSKFGKIGVVVGFVVGNIALNYWANGFNDMYLRIGEILVASSVLLFMPKRLEMKLDKLFSNKLALDSPYNKTLASSEEVRYRLNAVSGIFDDMSINLKERLDADLAYDTKETIKRYLSAYKEKECIGCHGYKECLSDEKMNLTVDYIISNLDGGNELNDNILKLSCDKGKKLVEEINEIYKNIKIAYVIKQKEKENSIRIAKQYQEVSKVINNIAENIILDKVVSDEPKEELLKEELRLLGYNVYDSELKIVKNEENDDTMIEYTVITDILKDIDEEKKSISKIVSGILEKNMIVKVIINSSKNEKAKIKMISKPKFDIKMGVAKIVKDGSDVSGDSYATMKLEDGKQLVILSDGAGSGRQAKENSNTVINMLEKLLKGGFKKEKAIAIVNSLVKLQNEGEQFATVDIALFDLQNKTGEHIKIGTAPTYILSDGKITTLNSCNLPIGIVDNFDYVPITKKLEENSYVIMVSDGAIDENDEDISNNKITRYLQSIDNNPEPQELAEKLLKEVIGSNAKTKDDITVIAINITNC